ncbi:MAG TPA: dihydrodipicolinate synthase family protein, partial [Gammaproteobacteria bacterium]|nr:dihydrodipicolinate synthase family protein [Gammaproteobacteria bacterium]
MGQIDWRGVFPALTTKFAADGSPDWGAMASHLAFQLDAGVQGIVILGSLGESATLSREEKREAVKRFCETDRRGKPLVVTIAECSTRGACAFAEVCESEGADAIMLPPPMRYPSDWRETRRYLNEVASATGLPIMLYNNPVAYGTDIDPAQFAELADNPRFEAIKESSADTRRVADIRRLTGDRYAVLCGVDNIALECFVLGACGWVAGLVVAFPSETVRLYELASAGEWDEARRLYEW